jgi:hypothetical protein
MSDDDAAAPENTGRDQAGRFATGKSGDVAGKPRCRSGVRDPVALPAGRPGVIQAGGVIRLGEVAGRASVIHIACRLCPRHGRRRTDRLLAEHGLDMPMPDLLRLLAAGCPRLDSTNITDRCDVHCPDLSKLFLPTVASSGPGPI